MINRELAQTLVAEFEGAEHRRGLAGAAGRHVMVRNTVESHTRLWRMRHLLRADVPVPSGTSSHSAA